MILFCPAVEAEAEFSVLSSRPWSDLRLWGLSLDVLRKTQDFKKMEFRSFCQLKDKKKNK